MTKICIAGCILCTLLLMSVAVSADGNVTIISNPAGATIIFDTVSQSNVTPTTINNVTTGSHSIRLHVDEYVDTWVNITVTGDQTVTASLSQIVTTTATTATPTTSPVVNGSISFTSSPANANVYINSVLKGYTPLTVYNITPDSYTVRIQKPGYLIYAQRFNVTPGNTTTVSAILTAEPTDTPTTAATAPPTTATTATPLPIKSPAKTYTPWPTSTQTQKSPLPLVISLAALGLGLAVLRKK